MLLTALLSFSQQEFRLTEDLIEAPDQEVVFKPLGIIVGEAYRENLFVAIQQNPQRMGLYNEQKEEIETDSDQRKEELAEKERRKEFI